MRNAPGGLKGKKVSSTRRGSYFGYSHPEVKTKRLHEENMRAEVEKKARLAKKKKKLALKVCSAMLLGDIR